MLAHKGSDRSREEYFTFTPAVMLHIFVLACICMYMHLLVHFNLAKLCTVKDSFGPQISFVFRVGGQDVVRERGQFNKCCIEADYVESSAKMK